MDRIPNFKEDDEKYGKFGEKDFEEYCKENNLNVLDVSKDIKFQLADIDFLASKKPIGVINNIHNLLFSRNVEGRDILKFEVKTDTRSFETRNVVYEVISHDSAGCMAESKADYVYYLFVDDSTGEIVKKEVWSIYLPAWRRYLREHFFDGKVSVADSERLYGIRRNNYNTHGDAVANLLCKIEKLQEHGIAKKLF